MSTAAIAIPFAPREDLRPSSPLARSPYQLAKSPVFPIHAPLTPDYSPDSPFDIKSSPPAFAPLPPTLPLANLTKANRPTVLVPPASPFPPIFSGSIMNNFKAALSAIDLDECDAHGENAFFVCDLAEVYRQHMRWTKELGDRVEAFFGSFFCLLAHSRCVLTFSLLQRSNATPIRTSCTFSLL